MRAKAERTFRCGFVLTEQELHRLLDVSVQQMKRVGTTSEPVVHFEVDFRNGATAETKNIDEVLSLENAGSRSVTCLRIALGDTGDAGTSTNWIQLEFRDPGGEDYGFLARSVGYVVTDEDRSWVFITSSELEERINKIKTVALGRLLGWEAAYAAVLLIIVVAVFGSVLPVVAQRDRSVVAAIEKVEEAYRRGAIKDPVEAVILLEKESHSPRGGTAVFTRGILIAGALFLFLAGLWLFVHRLFPAYNFCWGDYLALYERKLAVRRYVLIAVITGILVSVIGGVIVNRTYPMR